MPSSNMVPARASMRSNIRDAAVAPGIRLEGQWRDGRRPTKPDLALLCLVDRGAGAVRRCRGLQRWGAAKRRGATEQLGPVRQLRREATATGLRSVGLRWR